MKKVTIERGASPTHRINLKGFFVEDGDTLVLDTIKSSGRVVVDWETNGRTVQNIIVVASENELFSLVQLQGWSIKEQ